MSIEENKAIVLRHLKDVLEQGRVGLIESYYAPDGSVPGMDTSQQWRERVLWHHKTCPGFTITILDMMAEGEKVMVYTDNNLTYSVPANPPPSNFPPLGLPFRWRNMNIYRIVNGMLVSDQSVLGWKDMLVDIGVIPLNQIEQNKAAIRKFVDGVNTQNSALLAEVCTPEVAKSWTEMLPGMYARMKDHHIELIEMVADCDGVAVKMATSGYHTGVIQNLPATGKWWTNRVFAFFRFVDGQIVQVDLLPDAVNIAKQLGGTIQPAAA